MVNNSRYGVLASLLDHDLLERLASQAELDGKAFAFNRLMLPLASAAGSACDMLLVATVRPSDHIVSAIRARLALA